MHNLERNTPHWNRTARECYEIGCNCRNCLIFIVLGYRCKMKQAVFELVRKFGVPKEDELHLTKTQQRVIDAILNGAITKAEMAKYTGLTEVHVQSALSDMYEIAENDGVVYKNLRHKLPQFVKFVQSGGFEG